MRGEPSASRSARSGCRWFPGERVVHRRKTPDVPLTVEQRILEAAVRLPPGALVTGWAALRLAGAAWFDGRVPGGRTPQPVPVLLPHASRIRGPGVLVERTRGALPPAVERHGIPCVPGEVALLHEARRVGSPRRAGVMVDMALAARVVDLDALRVLASLRRQPDAAAYALERACGECRSPKESEMLQVWEGGLGFPRPLMNRQVLDLSGRVIAVADLLDEESGTCGEYNGAAHRSRERQRRDEARADALRDVGLELFVLVAGDPERVWRERMQSARRRALWLPPDRRRWRVGAFVPAPPLVEEDEEDEDQAALDAMMLEHYRSLG